MSAGLLILIALVCVILVLTAAILTGTHRRRARVPPAGPRRTVDALNELGHDADRIYR